MTVFKVNLGSIKETFFVRKRLNEEHMFMLAELYESGLPLPPLSVTSTDEPNIYELIDGRHRLHALQFLGRTEAEVHLFEERDRGKLIAMALNSNIGGALPPTREDITYSIRQMLEAGVSRAEVSKLLPFPPSLVKKHFDAVAAAVSRERVTRAVKDVTDKNMNVEEAAKKHQVDPDTVKTVISGNRHKALGIGELKANISNLYGNRQKSLLALWNKTLRAFEDDELNTLQVAEVLLHIDNLNKSAISTSRNWEKRWKTLRAQKEAS